MQINTTSELTIRESLIAIANKLIISKAIRINDRTFSFIDIEIYFWHALHWSSPLLIGLLFKNNILYFSKT